MSSRNRSEFFQALFTPNPHLLPTYAAGTICITLILNILFDILTGHSTWTGIIFVIVVACITGAIAYWAWSKQKSFPFYWTEGKPLPKYKGLVVIVSTPGIVKELLKHHGSELQHLWIITNFEHKAYAHFSSEILPTMRRELEEQKCRLNFSVHPLHFDQSKSTDAKNAYLATTKAFEEALKEYGLQPSQVVADITGGTKEMTIGMALACALHRWPMSYVRSSYIWIENKKSNERQPGNEEVLELDVSFITPTFTGDTLSE